MSPRKKSEIQNNKQISEKDLEKKIISEWVENFTPTEEDKRRRILPHDQEQLCRGVQCRVRLDRWNLVHDYYKKFGPRLENKSTKSILKLLAKAVSRYKDSVYTDEEIKNQHQVEWPFRKKSSIMMLDFWAYKRQKALTTAQLEANQIETINIPIRSMSTETIEMEHLGEESMLIPAASPAGNTVEHAGKSNAGVYSQVLNEYMAFNTESMIISTQSSNAYSLKESEPLILNTDEFNLSIPLTSTQGDGVEQ